MRFCDVINKATKRQNGNRIDMTLGILRSYHRIRCDRRVEQREVRGGHHYRIPRNDGLRTRRMCDADVRWLREQKLGNG